MSTLDRYEKQFLSALEAGRLKSTERRNLGSDLVSVHATQSGYRKISVIRGSESRLPGL
jgi:hypothetical protein